MHFLRPAATRAPVRPASTSARKTSVVFDSKTLETVIEIERKREIEIEIEIER